LFPKTYKGKTKTFDDEEKSDRISLQQMSGIAETESKRCLTVEQAVSKGF
jgi:hypothetical protein